MQVSDSIDNLLTDAKVVRDMIAQFDKMPWRVTPDVQEQFDWFMRRYGMVNEVVRFQVYMRTGLTNKELKRFKDKLVHNGGESS